VAAQICLEKFKQAARDNRVELFFMDEAGMSTVPNVQRAWSPLSEPHAADASGTKSRVNILGALNYGANFLIHSIHKGSVKRDHIVDFIDNLAQKTKTGKPIIVVLDNATVHHNIDQEKINHWLANHKLMLWHIPPYSPELNLIEILWKQAKYHWRKFTTWTKESLLEEVSNIFCAYGNKFKINYA